MFELFLEHQKNQKVANILNERGYRTRNGAMFKHVTVDRLLRDPIAKDMRRMNYTKSLGKGKAWKVKEKEDWVFHEVPAIVETELWDKVNELLENGDQNREPRKRGTVHLFSGILKCSCGGIMYMRVRSPRYVCQECKNKIMPDDIEAVYQEQVKAFIFSDEEIRKQLDKDFNEVKKKEDEIKRQNQKADEISKIIEGVLDLFHSGQIKKESFKSYHEPLELQLQQIRENITEVSSEIDKLQSGGISLDFFIQDMRSLSSFWEMMSVEEKRKTINTTTESIIVSNSTDEIEINMKYNPNPYSLENVPNDVHNHKDS
jgi:site-specific DNA recombinase